MPARDLDTVSVSKLTVVNGAPGGGTSGSVNVAVGYPVPQITSISPTTTSVSPSPFVSITITGTGFVPKSNVRFGTLNVGTTSVTPTQIVVSIASYYVGTPGTLPISVINPGPGGGPSNTVDFNVAYPVATVDVASPDSTFTGAAFTLTLTGTGFGTGSRVQWNGQDRPTTFVSTTQLTAAIPSSDVGSPNVAAVTVFSPAPGGGTSNVLSYRVVEQAPVITNVNPGFVSAGSGSTTLTITGTNYPTGATAQWNGAGRSATLVNGTSMTMTLTPADVATAQVGQVTVTNPGASGVSNAVAIGVVAPGASLAIQRTVTLTHVDLAYDTQRNVLYASIPSSASQYANSVVRIDPASGTVTGTVNVGSDPGPIAITDDGQYLYVGLVGAPTIVRLALSAFAKDIDIPLPVTGGDVMYAEDIQPIPGLPQTFAVLTFHALVFSRSAGVLLFDNAALRSPSAASNTGSNRITRGIDGTRIYGYNNESTEFGFRSLVVGANGLREESTNVGLINTFNADIEYGGGFVYATTGDVVNVSTMSKAGKIPANGIVRPDAANAQVRFPQWADHLHVSLHLVRSPGVIHGRSARRSHEVDPLGHRRPRRRRRIDDRPDERRTGGAVDVRGPLRFAPQRLQARIPGCHTRRGNPVSGSEAC